MTMYQADPFLQLVGDSKLQAVNNPEEDNSCKVYSSKEDNEDALKSLSAIALTENQSRESFASVIVKFIARSPEVTFIFIILFKVSTRQ